MFIGTNFPFSEPTKVGCDQAECGGHDTNVIPMTGADQLSRGDWKYCSSPVSITRN